MGTSAALIAFIGVTIVATALLAWALSLKRQIRRAREAERNLEAKYQDFLACSADWYWEMDADGRFVRFERGAQSAVPDVEGPDRLPYGKTPPGSHRRRYRSGPLAPPCRRSGRRTPLR
ncbi:LapA family protein [Elstera litoralis]|uniref:LapA family protein n=1 Tax=Elstera litoralis TaxID=552518 RepID=UPI0018DEB9C7|nr:LapA family protein [Elstera litoralis]